jgi:hypothetical protein
MNDLFYNHTLFPYPYSVFVLTGTILIVIYDQFLILNLLMNAFGLKFFFIVPKPLNTIWPFWKLD